VASSKNRRPTPTPIPAFAAVVSPDELLIFVIGTDVLLPFEVDVAEVDIAEDMSTVVVG
jgi:hypothetical protein